ncbi:MAG: hypothetical protein KatS3mg057_1609 [Herpetosiphonaceae bacterium]|nr:MAG: hypothetical protein KatS3mg057_1609 [Herpetosiphonaceae bacterium]
MNLNQRPSGDNKLILVGTIAVLVIGLLACTFVINLISSGAAALIPLAAGALLLLGNGREALSFWRLRKAGSPLFNTMVGLALILFGIGTTIFGGNFLRFIFYGPALALLVLALPMALGRPSLYNTYSQWARRSGEAARAVLRGNRRAPSPRQTIQLDPQQDVYSSTTQRENQRQ